MILSWGSFVIPAKSFIRFCELKIFDNMYLSYLSQIFRNNNNNNNTELNTHIMFLDTQEIPNIKKKILIYVLGILLGPFGIPGKNS